ncbi:phage terminase small subunit-related protein [Cohnella cellulosilytica]|uniref:phage terminase small subunit-related protein n=1 Tax=Cohnella cellulosilytica TaxID=986710 RepID=UPI00360CEAD0
MAKERSPNRDKAKQMWLESGGKMLLKDIAAALSLGKPRYESGRVRTNGLPI